MASSSTLFDEAMKLSPAERAKLVTQLIQALEPDEPEVGEQEEIDAAWAAEYEERIARYERGETTAVDWRESIERLRQSLEQRARKQ